MADIDNFEISWQGLTHGQVEDAIKAKVAALVQLISQGSASVAELSPIVTGLRADVNNLLASYPASKVSISGYSSLLAKLNEMDVQIAQASQTGGDVDLSDYYTKTETNNTFATKTELNAKQDALVAGNGIVIAQDGKTVSVDVEVVQPVTADGTFTIRIGNNTYTINLNHEHPDYQPKLTSANAGSNITITTDPQTGEVTISAAGGGGGSVTIDPSITGANQANPVAGGAIYTALQGKANASEMSIDAVSGDSTKMTIQLKSGVAQNVVTEHQSLAGRVQSQDVVSIVKITQAAYDALSTKDSTTLYLITGS